MSRSLRICCVGLLLAAEAHAEGGAAIAVAKPGGGQGALAVGFTPDQKLLARVCAALPCDTAGGIALPVPAESLRFAPGARLTIAPLGAARRAVVVELVDPAGAASWAAVVAAPLSGTAPLVVWSGGTEFAGVEGERSASAVLVRPEGVYVGTRREGSDLCGRPALLGPRAVDPATLTLKAAKLQRLGDEERERAVALEARPTAEPAVKGPPLLRARWATSAGQGHPPGALTDGKPETAWTEDRGGIGRGELVVMASPSAVPLRGFELTLPAAPVTPPNEVFVATDRELFRIALPPQPKPARAAPAPPAAGAPAVAPVTPPGARYELSLPSPVRTSCVALVIEDAKAAAKDASVGVAELGAVPAAPSSLDDLVKALAGGGQESEAAGAVLRVSGDPAFEAVSARFGALDEGGRRVALDVLDDAPCRIALPAYVAALVGPFEAHRLHARSVLARCGAETAGALGAAFAGADAKQRALLAEELATAAPAAAVALLAPLLGTSRAEDRRAYRTAIRRAAESNDALAEAGRLLGDAATTKRARLDLLRALGPRLSALGPIADQAFGATLDAGATFRTRYLLLEVAAEIETASPRAQAFLRQALSSDESAHVRAEAARVLASPRSYAGELLRLLVDPASPRVREAAALALGNARAEAALPHLVDRLARDAWPLVREASARSLAALPAGATADGALSSSLGDESKNVRRAAAFALGARGAKASAPLLRERLVDAEEDAGVRATTALALGAMCDSASVDALSELAGRVYGPSAGEADRLVGKAAVAALGRLAPPDLERRLAPLRAKGAPAAVRQLADSAVRTPRRCPKPAR